MNKDYEIDCKWCRGTGLYTGIAEYEGCAVICYYCKGTGHVTHTVPEEFQGRRVRTDIERVFKDSFRYTHTVYSDGGCTYEEFRAGKRPKPVKDLYCPFIWCDQEMQNKDHPLYEWHKVNCMISTVGWGNRISECSNYDNKAKCWEEYEKVSKDWDEV